MMSHTHFHHMCSVYFSKHFFTRFSKTRRTIRRRTRGRRRSRKRRIRKKCHMHFCVYALGKCNIWFLDTFSTQGVSWKAQWAIALSFMSGVEQRHSHFGLDILAPSSDLHLAMRDKDWYAEKAHGKFGKFTTGSITSFWAAGLTDAGPGSSSGVAALAHGGQPWSGPRGWFRKRSLPLTTGWWNSYPPTWANPF